MFERFTPEARRVVVLGQEHARRRPIEYIAPEHLLLGVLTMGDTIAVRALAGIGVDRDGLVNQLELMMQRGTQTPAGHIPFTPRAKQTLEEALREALQQHVEWVGAEHILLGCLRVGSGVACTALTNAGAEITRLRAEVVRLRAEAGPPDMVARSSGPQSSVVEATAPRLPTLAPDAEYVLGLARNEANQVGHGAVGTVHLMHALMYAYPQVVADVLSLDPAAVQALGEQIKAELDQQWQPPP